MLSNIGFDQLDEFTKNLSAELKAGDVILLYGDMGAGKTTFVSSLASHYGVKEACSPTFTLVNQYRGHVPMNHLDLYRLQSEDDLYSIDIERYLTDQTSITCIEWPERLGVFTPKDAISIRLDYVDDSHRNIEVIRSQKPSA